MSEMDTTRIFRTFLPAFLLTAALVLGGCFDQISSEYDDEDQIAFAFDLVAAGQDSDSPAQVAIRDSIFGGSTLNLETELIGPQRSSETEVSYGVVNETVYYTKEVPQDTGGVAIDSTLLARPTTAESGTHYQLPGSYTLPADSSSANLPVQVLDGLDAGDAPVRLSLRIDGNPDQNLFPAEQLRYLEVIITP